MSRDEFSPYNFLEQFQPTERIEPADFKREHLAEHLGVAATNPSYSIAYGDGFEAYIGEEVAYASVVVVRFLPYVLNVASREKKLKESPTVEVTTGYRRKNLFGITQSNDPKTRLVVDRVKQIGIIKGEEIQGLRFAGISGSQDATVDVLHEGHKGHMVYFGLPRDTTLEATDVIKEVEQLRKELTSLG